MYQHVMAHVQQIAQAIVHRHVKMHVEKIAKTDAKTDAQQVAKRHVKANVKRNVQRPVQTTVQTIVLVNVLQLAQMLVKLRLRNTALTVLAIVHRAVQKLAQMLARLRHLKDVPIVLHNVVEIVSTSVHTVVDASAMYRVVVNAKVSVVELVRWNAHHTLKTRLVPLAVEHVEVHVTRIVHTIVILLVRA